MKVEIYSDVVCPWCYVGKRRFASALADFAGAEDVDVVFRPYQLDPTAPASPLPLMQYLERRFGGNGAAMMQHVTDAAATEGITIAWDAAQSVNTHTAHRLLRLAATEYPAGVQHDLAEGLFAAHFTHGENVADHAVLTRLATAAGMDADRVRAYLASGEGSEELDAELSTAREAGIQSVPTFVFEGQYAVSGAQPVAVFRQVLEEVRRLAADADPEPAAP